MVLRTKSLPWGPKNLIIILVGDPKTTREVLCGRCLAQHHLVEESWGEKGQEEVFWRVINYQEHCTVLMVIH